MSDSTLSQWELTPGGVNMEFEQPPDLSLSWQQEEKPKPPPQAQPPAPPPELTADELMAVCADYRLVRIRRTEARTGPGGPGDLAWVWPAAAFALLPLALRPRRK